MDKMDVEREHLVEFKDFFERSKLSVFISRLEIGDIISIETLKGDIFCEEQQLWLKDTEKYRIWHWNI